MSDEVFKQDIDDESVLEPGGPYIIQMLFKKTVEMPDKDEMIHIMKKHVGPIESFCYDEKMAGMFIGIFAGMYYIYVGTRCRHDTSHEEV